MADLTEDDIALAGEYALGLLNAAERAGTSARVATDPDFAAEVEAWRVRLIPMHGKTSEQPSAEVWEKINAQLNPVHNGAHAPQRFWKGLSILSTSAAMAMAFFLYLQPLQNGQPADVPLIVAMKGEAGTASITASYNAQNGEILLTPVLLNTGDLYPELWVIPADGTARSLGIISGAHATLMKVPNEMRRHMAEGGTLAITPEPEGGAPGGKATGPVIASGIIISI